MLTFSQDPLALRFELDRPTTEEEEDGDEETLNGIFSSSLLLVALICVPKLVLILAVAGATWTFVLDVPQRNRLLGRWLLLQLIDAPAKDKDVGEASTADLVWLVVVAPPEATDCSFSSSISSISKI